MPEPLIGLLEAVWSDIEAVCADLTEEQWNVPTDCPGWSVKDNVAHMLGTENMLAGVDPPEVEIGAPDHVRNDIGKFNEQWVAAYRVKSGAETLAAFREITRARLDALRALTPEQWDEEGFTPEGRGPYRSFMAIRVFDCWYHDQDIREALGTPGCLDGPEADLSLNRIPPKGLPYVVGKKAGAPPGTVVVFEVEGMDPAAIAVPPEGRASLLNEVPADVTARIALDRRTFARLAGGRWTGDHARKAGDVRVEGDTELANRVVDNLAFTI